MTRDHVATLLAMAAKSAGYNTDRGFDPGDLAAWAERRILECKKDLERQPPPDTVAKLYIHIAELTALTRGARFVALRESIDD